MSFGDIVLSQNVFAGKRHEICDAGSVHSDPTQHLAETLLTWLIIEIDQEIVMKKRPKANNRLHDLRDGTRGRVTPEGAPHSKGIDDPRAVDDGGEVVVSPGAHVQAVKQRTNDGDDVGNAKAAFERN